MKNRITFLALFLLFCGMLPAQSLEFNQVRMMEYQYVVQLGVDPDTLVLDTTLIVPPGKVLKIESTASGVRSSDKDYFNLTASHSIMLNNTCISYRNNVTTEYAAVLPYWLPEGTYTLAIRWANSISNTRVRTVASSISGIEFNVVP